MNTTSGTGGDQGEDPDVARLLRLAGPRPAPSREREQRVKAAVLGEWRASVRARRRRQQVALVAALAAAAAMVVAVRLGWTKVDPAPAPPVTFATIDRVAGAGASRASRLPTEAALLRQAGQTVLVGDNITTVAGGRLGLRLPSGLSLRLDHATTIRLESPDRIVLTSGAVYVDSDAASRIVIDTPFGAVRDVGTRFEVRLDPERLRIQVRAGLIEVTRGGDVRHAAASTGLTIDDSGVQAFSVQPFGPAWAWASEVAPRFDADGRPLTALLEHVCREQGWTLTWTDRPLNLEASRIVVHGALGDLAPQDQLRVALATSGLASRLEGDRLVVFRPSAP